jgi:hypothetical protein
VLFLIRVYIAGDYEAARAAILVRVSLIEAFVRFIDKYGAICYIYAAIFIGVSFFA